MTDEERQKLCKALRSCPVDAVEIIAWMRMAANEIERLAALAQSDAKPAQSQTLRDAAENLLIAIGMGWDIDGCVENLRAALAQSDAEPKNVWGMLEKAIIASTLPEHKAADAEFMRASIRLANEFAKDALAALAQSDAEPVGGSLAEARTIALEQRCERGTPWDLACVTIANKIGEKCGYPPIPTNAAPPRPDTSAGMSWSGFNVYGDKKSIDAVRNALHAKDRCEALDKMIGEKQLVRPDTSAGLIEAAELLESIAKIELTISRRAAFNEAAVFLRARATSEPNQARNREGGASARECGQ